MGINPTITTAVFDGAHALINGAQTVTNAAATTFNAVQNIATNPQQIGADFSRRDYTMAQPQQPVVYQPPVYPWESQQLGAYSFTNVMNTVPNYGYAGISNPQYGQNGYIPPAQQQAPAGSSPMFGADFHYPGLSGGWRF